MLAIHRTIKILLAIKLFFMASTASAVINQSNHKLSQRFYTKVSFPYKGKNAPHKVIYGNDNYGYYSTQSFYLKNNKIHINLMPPGYKYKISFFKPQRKRNAKKMQIIGRKKFTSPLPKIFKSQRGYLKHGRFSSNYFIVSGALARGKYWNPHFISTNPDIYKKSQYRFTFTLILNRLGEIVWVHIPKHQDELFQTYVATKPLKKGTYGVLLGKQAGFFQVVRYDGRVIKELRSRDVENPFTMHHDFLYTSNESIYAISSRAAKTRTLKAKRLGKSFLSDTIIKVNLHKGKHRKVIDFLKYYKPDTNPFYTGDDKGDHKFVLWNKEKVDFDFLHINTIEESNEGYLLGIRNLNKVIMMDRSFSRIKWSLGWDKKSTFQIKREKDRFYHIHTPIKTKSGNIMVFDNGYKNARSRIVEYVLDYNKKEAKKAWSFEPKPRLYSKDRGSISILKNRNVVAYFVSPEKGSQKAPEEPPKDYILEIDRKNGHEKARMLRRFEVMSPGYRAIPINELGRETYIGSRL